MRIGVDMLAVQSPWTRLRGIGRLSRNLVAALLAHDRANEYVLYGYEGLPTDRIIASGRAPTVLLRPDPGRGERTLHDAVDRLVRTNPDGLDVYFLLSPMDLHGGYAPPAKPLNGLKLAAFVYDLIPFLFQEKTLRDPFFAVPLYRHLERLRRYDVLVTCSDATRFDAIRLLGLSDRQVVTAHCATERGVFYPDRPGAGAEPLPRVLRDLGIDRPYVFNLGGMDEENDRKNLFGLIDAFGLLPESLRLSHQLVLSCAMHETFAGRLRGFARGHGVGDQLVLTDEVSDTVLRRLYQRCAAFAFPSFYEGFGLPLLEAMQCGAAVVAGNNSSQVEVVGDGGLLANAHDAFDIAEKLARILDDPDFARQLGRRAVEQARRFDWERTARRTVDALADAPGWTPPPLLRVHRSHRPRPRVAVFSPFPPKLSGIADYTRLLLEGLKADYAIDLYHDIGYVPEPGLGTAEFGCFDYRLFARRSALLNYHAVLYQMGNSTYHGFVYDTLQNHPGIVTLHDFCLAGFQYWRARLPGAAADAFRREIEHCDPGRAAEVLPKLDEWAERPGGVPQACVEDRLYLNRRVFERAERVIVHSAWCLAEVGRLFPEHAEKTVVVPHGSEAEVVAPERIAAVRRRFDLPREALVFGSFGIMSRSKMNVESVEAFAAIAAAFPSALFLFVGEDWDRGEARGKAAELGLNARVRFLGRQPEADFAGLVAAVDVGVNLRRAPTHGETSGALLNLLRMGVPSVVTDVGTFSDFPGSVVHKVDWRNDGPDGLRRALYVMASDPEYRSQLGRAARQYVAERHAWPRVAASYAAVFDRRDDARAGRRAGAPPLTGMHRQPSTGLAPASS